MKNISTINPIIINNTEDLLVKVHAHLINQSVKGGCVTWSWRVITLVAAILNPLGNIPSKE